MATVSPCSSLTPNQALQGGCVLILLKSQSHISPLYSPTCLRWCASEEMFGRLYLRVFPAEVFSAPSPKESFAKVLLMCQ